VKTICRSDLGLAVCSMAPNGPAALSGKIKLGDELIAVDGMPSRDCAHCVISRSSMTLKHVCDFPVFVSDKCALQCNSPRGCSCMLSAFPLHATLARPASIITASAAFGMAHGAQRTEAVRHRRAHCADVHIAANSTNTRIHGGQRARLD
jgi:hypothetical protein